jgi:hypothetical protein
MASDLNLAALDQLSREYIETPTVYDQVFESSSTLDLMKKAGMVEMNADLGPDYQWMVRDSLPPGPTPYSDYETFPLAASDPFDRVHLTPVNYAQTLVIPKTKLDANMGSSKLADLLGEVMDAGVQNFSAGLNVDLFNLGTDAQRLVGFRLGIAEAPTTGTYAGVNRATDAWWRNLANVDVGNYTRTNLVDVTSAYYIFTQLDRCVTLLKQNGQNPINYVIVATGGLASLIQEEIRYPYLNIGMGDLKRPDASPINLYHATIPIHPDVDCPDDGTTTFAYFLNKKTTKLIFGKLYGGGKEKKMGIFEWGGWQDMTPVQEVIAGNLKCRAVLAVKQPGANLVFGVQASSVPGLIT